MRIPATGLRRRHAATRHAATPPRTAATFPHATAPPTVARVPASAPFVIRPIRPCDDAAIATIIRDVLTEHGCSGPGFALNDPETQAMSRAYATKDARYFVIEHDGVVVGGAGFGRLAGTDGREAICELRKMYFLPRARGLGLGRALLALLLDEMRACGYRRCYLETATAMEKAQALYRHMGFSEQCSAHGDTGHHGCDRFFARDL